MNWTLNLCYEFYSKCYI